MPLPQLISHEFVLVPLLLAGIQLLGEDQQGLLLALQLPLTHQVLQNKGPLVRNGRWALQPQGTVLHIPTPLYGSGSHTFRHFPVAYVQNGCHMA